MELLFTKIHKKISVKRFNDEEIVIRPFGDTHCDSDAHDRDRWVKTLTHWKKTDTPNTYYVGMGDYMDFMSTSERKTIKSVSDNIHKQTLMTLDKVAEKQVKDFAKDIEFMRGRLLGFIDGNHSYTFLDTKTSTQKLCDIFETNNLGWLSCFRLSVNVGSKGKGENRNGYYHYDMILCHGRAGGRMEGTSINQVDDLRKVFPVADLYMMAHDHKKYAVPTTTLIFVKNAIEGFRIKQKEQYLCRTGSFLKAYEPNKEGYLIGGLGRPTSLGTIEMRIKPMLKITRDYTRLANKKCKTGSMHKRFEEQYFSVKAIM